VGTGDLISTEEILTNLKVDISRLENENENLKESNLEMKNEILQLLNKVSEEPVVI
jgi:predicted RNase H-like nuclease (RuvC/YqgF family)